ncbi:CRTAC1 family protein [Thalassoroseus pseudoceratinae]|uniref:CRTAC1 family protein n=1 Tax=Thalassoroseus pseudoceratinae TaxID=2713176 RepID=UPI00141E73A2|nr:CRTAC1 family protein [Thalassoroseus pseudoceratinae]
MTAHERMTSWLRTIADSTAEEHPFLGSKRAKELASFVREVEDFYGDNIPADFRSWHLFYSSGKAEVRLGNLKAGIQRLKTANRLATQVDFSQDPLATQNPSAPESNLNQYYRNQTRFYLAVAMLRLGETQNCCAQNNAESCILPIQGRGLHTRQEGSRQAMQYFLQILEDSPDEVDANTAVELVESSRWLLNIASMTLGEWPEGIPEEYRVSEDFFHATPDFPRFTNVMPDLHLDTFNLCGGAVVDDFDGDGYLDIVTSTWDTQGEMRFFHNNQDGTFEDRSVDSQLGEFLGGLNMVHADYDNDGDLDLFVVRGAWLQEHGQHPNSLLENNGHGVFTDVTIPAGLADENYPSKTAAWADYDNDGDLDLFVGNESTTRLRAKNQLFRNNSDGTFTDVASDAGLNQQLFSMGAVWGDYDNDRFPDLFIATGFSDPLTALDGGGPNRLFHNDGEGHFVDVAVDLGVTKPIAAFPAWFWDYNNDGVLDLYVGCSSGPVGVLVSEHRFGRNHLFAGDGAGGFTDATESVGLTYPSQPMGANYGDLNNDGFPDFYLGTGNIEYSELQPNVMFLNESGQRFTNVTYAGGFGHLQKGHGVSFADLDNDGDQDVYVQLGGAWPGDKYYDALFENPGFDNHWLSIQLEGRQSNRSAIGARIRVEIRENGKSRTIYKHVCSGGSFGGNPLRQSIGLGQADRIDKLEIYWPTSDTTQTFQNVAVDQFIHIVEGEDKILQQELRSFKLGSPSY